VDPARWERLQEIFLAAADLDPADRNAFLLEACGGEEELRSDVARCLRSLDSGHDLLSDAIHAEAAVALASAGPAPGDRIGPYRLVRQLGHGGMGSVFLAERDDREFRHEVAIKLIRPEAAASPDLLRRFRAERQILAGLDHPNIARLLGGGISPNGAPYLVMELVEGMPIDEYCRAHGLGLRARIHLFRAVCAAVEYAHRNLVVHRDIKPSNILVTPEGTPKLLDFGIAKLLKPADPELTIAQTGPADRLMTIEYASPEQVRGTPVTTATDVFALGIVLYELLASASPFDIRKLDFLEAQRAICETAPPPPSRIVAAPAQARRLKGDLDSIVMMALRKEPEARYSSVEQFSEDSRRYLEGFPVLAGKGTSRYRALKFLRRHRVAAAVSAASGVLIMGFGIGMAVLAARVTRERDAVRVERTRAAQISQFLTSLFSSSDPFVSQGNPITAKELLDNGSKRILRDLANQPAVRADLLETMADAYKHLGLTADAESAFREQARAAQEAFGPESAPAARALRLLGDAERGRGKAAQAESDLRRALTIQEKILQPWDIEISHTLNNLSLVLQARGDVAAAESLLRRAVEISRRDPAQITETLIMESNLGALLSDRGNYEAAEAMLREVLARRTAVLGPNHPQVALSMQRLAFFLDRKGAWTEAESLTREALRRYRNLYSDSHPQTLTATNNLAMLLQKTGRLAEAEGLFRQAIDTATRAQYGTADTAVWSANLAGLLGEELKFAEATELFQRALDLCRAQLGPGSTREARILEQRGTMLAFLGKTAAATADFNQALAIRRSRLGPEHPDVASSLFDVGQYRDAVDMDRRLLPAGHPQLATHQLALARQTSSEPLAREALRARQANLPPNAWQIDDANLQLAAILSEKNHCDVALPLATSSLASLRRLPGEATVTFRTAAALTAGIEQHCAIH
jgi:serine/threonine-protein kinase